MLQDLTSHLAFAVVACVIGSGFQHGYNVGVTNSPQTILVKFFNDTQFHRNEKGFSEDSLTVVWSVAVAIFSVGGMIGGLLTAVMSNRFGRKRALILNNLIVIVAVVFQGFSYLAKSYEMFIIGRFIIGVNAGLNAGIAPMYLTEISPMALRGAIGSTYQLIITASILLSQALGLPECLGTSDLWPLLFVLVIIPAVIQVVTLFFCPESPKYTLLHHKDEAKCEEALKWLRQKEDVTTEMQQIRTELEAMNHVAKTTLKDLLTNPSLRKPLIVSVVMMLSQQLSGINAVIGFSTDIFGSAGLSSKTAVMATLIMGLVNFFVTIVSLWLVERAGRRPLYIGGLAGLALITALLTVCLALKDSVNFLKWGAVVLVYLFVAVFASGIGSIPWFIVSELFDQGARALATSIAVAANWLSSFLVMLVFLPIKLLVGEYVFLIFTALLVTFFVFTVIFVPETKNKPIEEIQAYFSLGKQQQQTNKHNNYRSTQQLTADD